MPSPRPARHPDRRARYRVISAGRRFSKTLLAIEWLALERGGAIDGYPVAFFSPTYKLLLDVFSAALETRREAVIATPWRLEPADGEAVAWLHEVLELYADPLLLGQVFDPSGFVTAMNTMGQERVVGVGKEETVAAVTPGAAGEFEKVELALARRIQKLILGQALTSEVGSGGSYAAAKVHDAVRQDKPPSGAPGPAVPLAANGQRFTADQELVEGLIAAALANAVSPIPAKAIRSAILAAEGPEDLAQRLAALYAGQDAAAFQELVERSLFAADVLGYATAEQRVGV